MIPANSSVRVKGSARVKRLHIANAVLLQEPSEHQLPGGLGVVAAKVDIGSLHNVSVDVVKFSDEPITLQKNSILCDVHVILAEYDICHALHVLNDRFETGEPVSENVHANVHSCGKSEVPDIKFKFGEDTPVEWRQHFTCRLKDFSDVFIRNDFDLGETKAMYLR
jgi:hypothetical protein